MCIKYESLSSCFFGGVFCQVVKFFAEQLCIWESAYTAQLYRQVSIPRGRPLCERRFSSRFAQDGWNCFSVSVAKTCLLLYFIHCRHDFRFRSALAPQFINYFDFFKSFEVRLFVARLLCWQTYWDMCLHAAASGVCQWPNYIEQETIVL